MFRSMISAVPNGPHSISAPRRSWVIATIVALSLATGPAAQATDSQKTPAALKRNLKRAASPQTSVLM